MIKAGHQRCELPPQHIADEGHDSLKQTEVCPGDQGVAYPDGRGGKSLAHGGSEGIHAQPQGDEQKLRPSHGSSS